MIPSNVLWRSANSDDGENLKNSATLTGAVIYLLEMRVSSIPSRHRATYITAQAICYRYIYRYVSNKREGTSLH